MKPDGARTVYDGKLIDVTLERWGDNEREIVEHPGSVAIVAVDGDRTTVTTTVLFHVVGERDGMLGAGMADGLEQSYTALDRVLIEAI